MSISDKRSSDHRNPESRTQRKRRKFFKVYSDNLFNVLKHPRISINIDEEEGFICPICYGFFNRDSLASEYDDRLTLEDVPPKYLGGKPRTLTCKICNNFAGSELDSHLINRLHFNEFIQGVKDASVDARFRPYPGIDLSSIVYIRGENRIFIEYDPERANPSQLKRFHTLASSGGIGEFDLNFRGKYKKNRSEIALLRIAYLLAFSKFGYGFLFRNNLSLVQQQLRYPKKTIMNSFGILNATWQDQMVGIHIITEPIEMRSFMIVFDLITKLRKTRHAVLLPGPSRPGIDVYNSLASASDPENPIRIKSCKIPEYKFLTNPNLAFTSGELWHSLCMRE